MAGSSKRPRPPQGQRLLDLRLAAGLTQLELAQIIQVSQANIALWERFDKPPRSDVLPALATALGCKVDDILEPSKPVALSKTGPVSKLQRVVGDLTHLPRKQQTQIVEVLAALVDQAKKKAS